MILREGAPRKGTAQRRAGLPARKQQGQNGEILLSYMITALTIIYIINSKERKD